MLHITRQYLFAVTKRKSTCIHLYLQLTLTVEQLPDLADGQTYHCVFDQNPPIQTTVSGNQLTCQTPPGSMIPAIPSGEGK